MFEQKKQKKNFIWDDLRIKIVFVGKNIFSDRENKKKYA